MSDLLPALTTAAPANPTVAQLSQSSADAVREVFAEAASANTRVGRDSCEKQPKVT